MRTAMKVLILTVITIAALFIGFTAALGHSGGTDSEGCHVCRTSCDFWGLETGERHCHQVKEIPEKKSGVGWETVAASGGTGAAYVLYRIVRG